MAPANWPAPASYQGVGRGESAFSTLAGRVVFPDGSDQEYLARMLPLLENAVLEKAVVKRGADGG
jgi:hypothetical protein